MKNPGVLHRLVQQLDVQLVADGVRVDGGVVVGQRIAVRRGGGRRSGRLRAGDGLLGEGVPELGEHIRVAPGGGAGDAEAAVLPVAVLHHRVDVLVGQVDPAAEGHPAVDHQNLAVVPVVQRAGEDQPHGVEGDALDAPGLQAGGVAGGQGGQAAQIVVDHPHVHPLGRLLRQDIRHAVPHGPLVHDEVLQVDGPLRPLHFLQHGGEEAAPPPR